MFCMQAHIVFYFVAHMLNSTWGQYLAGAHEFFFSGEKKHTQVGKKNAEDRVVLEIGERQRANLYGLCNHCRPIYPHIK